jgi:hypothetical protein
LSTCSSQRNWLSAPDYLHKCRRVISKNYYENVKCKQASREKRNEETEHNKTFTAISDLTIFFMISVEHEYNMNAAKICEMKR